MFVIPLGIILVVDVGIRTIKRQFFPSPLHLLKRTLRENNGSRKMFYSEFWRPNHQNRAEFHEFCSKFSQNFKIVLIKLIKILIQIF